MLPILAAIVPGIMKLGGMWMSNRQAKSDAKAAQAARVVQGQADYNSLAQQGMAASLKDEFLVLWTTGLVTMHFIPRYQETLEAGWEALANTAPDWFGYCFVGMYVAVFGLKGWKIFKS